MTDTILVTGANGKTGRRLVSLLEGGDWGVRAASRSPRNGQIPFYLQQSATHREALMGADAIYLVPPEMVENPIAIVAPFLAAAVDAGVRRVVLVSSMGAGFPAEPPTSGRRELEALVRDSRLEWTILRPSGFMQNFSEGFLLPAVRNGVLLNPAGDGRVAMIDAGDIAAVAATVLTDVGPSHFWQTYDLTGPALLGFSEAAATIARVSGRPVLPRAMTSPEFLATLQDAGVPPDYAAMLLRDQEAIRDGAAAVVSSTVAAIIGREPVDFATYASEAAAAWRH